MNKLLTILLATIFAGCAGPQYSQEFIAKAQEPLICSSKEQCDLYWSRAQVWVAENSRYAIHTATDNLIITGTSTNAYDFGIGYQVQKTPQKDGTSRITMHLFCTMNCDSLGQFQSLKDFVQEK